MMKKNRIYKKYTHRHTDNAKKIKAKQNKAKKENKQSTHTARMKEMAKIDMYIIFNANAHKHQNKYAIFISTNTT